MHRSLLIPAAFALWACSGDPAAPAFQETLQVSRFQAFESLVEGLSFYSAGIRSPERTVIRDAEAFEAAWYRALGAAVSPEMLPAPPQVDFERYMVILAAAGARPSAGFEIAVEEAAIRGASLEIDVLETVPDASCFTAAVMTTPVDLVRVARSDLPVTFTERATARSCG